MYKKRTKFIASMLVLMLTMTHFSIIGEVVATSFDNQTVATNNENVEFDAYFMEEKQKTHLTKIQVGEENYLYATVRVKNTGYLKNIVAELENANYEVISKVEDAKISKIEDNKIYFNQIRNGNTAEVKLPIQILKADTISVNEFNKESKVKLTATYVDGNGKEKQIKKDVAVNLAWTANKEAQITMQVERFVPYEVDEQKGIILQTVVKSNLKDNVLPVKENKVEITVPTVYEIAPKDVKVTTSDFEKVDYTYDQENKKLTIDVKNEPNEEGKVNWTKGVKDEFIVTYIYEGQEVKEEGVKITILANSELTVYETEETKVKGEYKGEATLKDKINELVDFSVETKVTELSKGQLYANTQAKNKIETEYKEIITANIGLAEVTDKIILEQSLDNFVTASNTKSEITEIYYKSVSVNKDEFNKILGEEGEIVLYALDTEVAKINKESKDEDFVINLKDLNVNTLRIETSKPQTEGKLNFNIVKAIKGKTEFTQENINTFNAIELNLTGKAVNGDINIAKQTVTENINLVEPTSQAELVIDNNNLSTVLTNKDVKLTAILKADTLNCSLYKNPTLNITLPSYIEKIDIKNVEVLFETEGSKLTLKSHQVKQNADGTKTIAIILEGTQTEYTLGAVSKGLNVVITSDIIVNKLTANRQDKIVMDYTNNNTISKTIETKQVATDINVTAPVGVITTSQISNYKENAEALVAMSGEEKTATIETLAEARNAKFDMTVINNYNNTIDNISILGRTPFKGNKDIEEQKDLGSTMDMPLVSNIKVSGVEESKVQIYYSENANATKDLKLETNKWTLTPEKLENVKSYLIVLKDYTMNTADRMSFTYEAQIPGKLQHNQSAFENYVVYFNNNLETGMLQDKESSTKLGVTTGRGPVLEASIKSHTPETEEVLTGNVIKYTITVKNTGTETAENVVATIDLPEGLKYIKWREGSITQYEILSFGGKTNIELGNIEPNKAIDKEILIKTSKDALVDKSTNVEIKALVGAGNISGHIETNIVKNKIEEAPFFTASETIIDSTKKLKEADEYEYYMRILSSSEKDSRKETVLDITLPKEIEYKGLEIKEEEKDITNSIKSKYDEKTRKLTIELGEVNGVNVKEISLKVAVGKLEDGVYDKTVNIEAKVSAKDVKTQEIVVEPVQIGKIGIKITQTSNIPENAHITAGEDFKYVFTIENLSNINLRNVKFTDILPKELILGYVVVTNESGNEFSTYVNSIKFAMSGKEIIKVEVYVTANALDESKTISNKAIVECEGIENITTPLYTHIIDKYEIKDYEEPESGENEEPGITDNQTKRIMGTVWIDENADGVKDQDEKKVSNVDMLLFNNETGEFVADSEGNLLTPATDENGTYTFSKISKGKYTVVFLYDTANYSATVYRKEGVDETQNSDAVDSKITLQGITRIAGITEEIEVKDSNIYNIDLGLVSNPKFDLRLDKTVSKITVQDSNGTNVYECNDTKLAKKDLVSKQIPNTTIIVEYKITVTNEGAVPGYVKKIVDYMPTEMKFNSELNRDWYTSESGILYNSSLSNTVIKPGESKAVTLTLTKKMTEDNLGLYHNEAEIYEAYNDLGIKDVDSKEANKTSEEDDISSADVLITVKTGEVILFIGLAITIILIIGSSAYFIKKKVIK